MKFEKKGMQCVDTFEITNKETGKVSTLCEVHDPETKKNETFFLNQRDSRIPEKLEEIDIVLEKNGRFYSLIVL